MTSWRAQINSLITPAVARSSVTKEVLIGHGTLSAAGDVAAKFAQSRKALVMADEAGFGAAGPATMAAFEGAGFTVRTAIKPCDPLPKASVEEAEPFRAALAADPDLFPVSVGSGVINDLVKFAAFETERPYLTVATAASMDGYTSAGAPLARDGFKITVPTRAPIAMIADLDVLAAAPAEMNGWGYADLAGKSPTGGDWILADLVGAEPLDDLTFPLVQDNLKGWLAGSEGIASGDADSLARLFVGLTAVGFAMEFHASSRPASGAEHQFAHLWEMEGLYHQGRKVSHGAAVAVGCLTTLGLYDWLIAQDLTQLDVDAVIAAAPSLEERLVALDAAIADARIAERARVELEAKHAPPDLHAERIAAVKQGWNEARAQLQARLYRREEMAAMLRAAGAPASAAEIGVSDAHLRRSANAAPFIRRRYTIFDFLHETGMWEAALEATQKHSQ
ncbi:sn-glycerol-1-phosphate dehydrogenase [Tropicimonas sp. IMCC6043]|uniref:sn-glycerol-1-phosphate dehydrogenase n=1 Tax=Tropicimonas sp. IMCC6043 TaxID=2510645 RepID=UPI00101DFB6C|nr:sn-glycerol-1-phosphate dehydrogenase [Tropicimonas sp. IMCC6043]RYH06216.1 iron-containing alcohol dehydrogenase [Tropicimonas sp. IMCC6043]